MMERRRATGSPANGDVADRDSFLRQEYGSEYPAREQKTRGERFNACNTLKSVICGQLVSVLMCGTAYCLQDIKSVHPSSREPASASAVVSPASTSSASPSSSASSPSASSVSSASASAAAAAASAVSSPKDSAAVFGGMAIFGGPGFAPVASAAAASNSNGMIVLGDGNSGAGAAAAAGDAHDVAGMLAGNGISGLSAGLVFPTYVIMFLIFIPFLACRRGENSLLNVVRGRGVKYFVVAAIDVEANYLIIHAYKYTTLPSVQMLDCFSIPIVLALSWLFLKVRYKIVHIAGVGICLLGVGSLVWSNVLEFNNTTPQNRLFGDMLCLSAGALYGVSNVLQEFTVKAFSGSVEFLAMIGLFASAISGIQTAILELDAVQAALTLPPPQQLPLIGFVICQTLIYLLVAVVISNSSATALNLSILSADGLSLLGYYYILNKTFGIHYLFVVSLSLVLVGVLLFSLAPTPLGCLVNIRLANQHLHSRLSVAVQLDADNSCAVEAQALRPPSGSSSSSNSSSCDSLTANGHYYPSHAPPPPRSSSHHRRHRHHRHHGGGGGGGGDGGGRPRRRGSAAAAAGGGGARGGYQQAAAAADFVQCTRVADYDLLR